MSEQPRWRPVPGFEGLYEVSDQGGVRSVERTVNYRDGRVRDYPSVDLATSDNGYGYRVVTLSQGKGVKKVRLVHQLVMEAFVGPRPEGWDTCHGNNVKSDNRLENLRYDTREANLADSNWLSEMCGRGHPIKEPNVLPSSRRCAACSRATSFCNYRQIEVTQEITDAYFREAVGSPRPGDDEIIGRKFKRSTNV